MYCSKCGNKLSTFDMFCSKCGKKISNKTITDIQEDEENDDDEIVEQFSENLPMNWWKFWQYCRLPVGLILSIISLYSYTEITMTPVMLFVLMINVLLIVLLVLTLYALIAKKMMGYYLLIITLFLSTLCNTFMNTFSNAKDSSDITEPCIVFLVSFGILCIIWILPNYIYFKKRRNLFCN